MKKIENIIVNKAVFIALSMFAVVILSYLSNFHRQYISHDSGDWGTFGDFVGGTLNPFFSFLALIILLRTFSMQRQELSLQRKELKKTKAILKTQSQTKVKQQFESTFFSLLNVHNQVLENLCKSNLQKFIDEGMTEWFNDLDGAKKILEENKNVYGHYFRILYQLLKFIATNSPKSKIGLSFEIEEINNSEVSSNEKMYSNIVRALLTDDVMKLLAVNCYCKNKDDIYWKYKLLVERYSLFEHASFNPKNNNEKTPLALIQAQEFYDEKAFSL